MRYLRCKGENPVNTGGQILCSRRSGRILSPTKQGGLQHGSIQAGIYRVYACLISRFPKMPKNPAFSRACGLLLKRQMYRNLSQIGVISHRNGVVNGVVDCS